MRATRALLGLGLVLMATAHVGCVDSDEPASEPVGHHRDTAALDGTGVAAIVTARDAPAEAPVSISLDKFEEQMKTVVRRIHRDVKEIEALVRRAKKDKAERTRARTFWQKLRLYKIRTESLPDNHLRKFASFVEGAVELGRLGQLKVDLPDCQRPASDGETEPSEAHDSTSHEECERALDLRVDRVRRRASSTVRVMVERMATALEMPKHLALLLRMRLHGALKAQAQMGVEAAELRMESDEDGTDVDSPFFKSRENSKHEGKVIAAELGVGTTSLALFHLLRPDVSTMWPLSGEHVSTPGVRFVDFEQAWDDSAEPTEQSDGDDSGDGNGDSEEDDNGGRDDDESGEEPDDPGESDGDDEGPRDPREELEDRKEEMEKMKEEFEAKKAEMEALGQRIERFGANAEQQANVMMSDLQAWAQAVAHNVQVYVTVDLPIAILKTLEILITAATGVAFVSLLGHVAYRAIMYLRRPPKIRPAEMCSTEALLECCRIETAGWRDQFTKYSEEKQSSAADGSSRDDEVTFGTWLSQQADSKHKAQCRPAVAKLRSLLTNAETELRTPPRDGAAINPGENLLVQVLDFPSSSSARKDAARELCSGRLVEHLACGSMECTMCEQVATILQSKQSPKGFCRSFSSSPYDRILGRSCDAVRLHASKFKWGRDLAAGRKGLAQVCATEGEICPADTPPSKLGHTALNRECYICRELAMRAVAGISPARYCKRIDKRYVERSEVCAATLKRFESKWPEPWLHRTGHWPRRTTEVAEGTVAEYIRDYPLTAQSVCRDQCSEAPAGDFLVPGSLSSMPEPGEVRDTEDEGNSSGNGILTRIYRKITYVPYPTYLEDMTGQAESWAAEASARLQEYEKKVKELNWAALVRGKINVSAGTIGKLTSAGLAVLSHDHGGALQLRDSMTLVTPGQSISPGTAPLDILHKPADATAALERIRAMLSAAYYNAKVTSHIRREWLPTITFDPVTQAPSGRSARAEMKRMLARWNAVLGCHARFEAYVDWTGTIVEALTAPFASVRSVFRVYDQAGAIPTKKQIRKAVSSSHNELNMLKDELDERIADAEKAIGKIGKKKSSRRAGAVAGPDSPVSLCYESLIDSMEEDRWILSRFGMQLSTRRIHKELKKKGEMQRIVMEMDQLGMITTIPAERERTFVTAISRDMEEIQGLQSFIGEVRGIGKGLKAVNKVRKLVKKELGASESLWLKVVKKLEKLHGKLLDAMDAGNEEMRGAAATGRDAFVSWERRRDLPFMAAIRAVAKEAETEEVSTESIGSDAVDVGVDEATGETTGSALAHSPDDSSSDSEVNGGADGGADEPTEP